MTPRGVSSHSRAGRVTYHTGLITCSFSDASDVWGFTSTVHSAVPNWFPKLRYVTQRYLIREGLGTPVGWTANPGLQSRPPPDDTP